MKTKIFIKVPAADWIADSFLLLRAQIQKEIQLFSTLLPKRADEMEQTIFRAFVYITRFRICDFARDFAYAILKIVTLRHLVDAKIEIRCEI